MKTRVLGIDLGLKRTGLALSDDLGLSIRLLPVCEAKNRQELLEIILNLTKEFSIKTILIGCPKEMTPKSKAIITRALSLKDALDNLFLEVNIILWDETLSSKKSLENLLQSGVPRKKRSKLIDANSAAIMVEEFLYSCKKI